MSRGQNSPHQLCSVMGNDGLAWHVHTYIHVSCTRTYVPRKHRAAKAARPKAGATGVRREGLQRRGACDGVIGLIVGGGMNGKLRRCRMV